jgi:hypothetical protein
MRRWLEAALVLILAGPAAAKDVAVEVTNASVPSACAENDNVTIAFASDSVRRFTVEARHPRYLTTLKQDRTVPDFNQCDMSHDPVYRFTPRSVTLYSGPRWRLVGHAYPQFWRPNDVPVRVGTRVEHGLHLLQLWTRGRSADEVLVLYPADGYWRAHPLPRLPLRKGVYGSSFLVGPIETAGRPLVDLTEVVFDPAASSFRLSFVRGGSATLSVADLDRDRINLSIRSDQTIAAVPFAMLRSMFVADDNADVARLAWRTPQGGLGSPLPIMNFQRVQTAEVWTGRVTPSRHNTSAPDIIFRAFRD